MNTLKFDNPYQQGAEWGLKALENGRMVVVNPNNMLRGVVIIDEIKGVHVEGPLAAEARYSDDPTILRRVTDQVTNMVAGHQN